MSDQTISDVFYVKTRDSTVFTIYDLTLSNECDIISFGYNFIDENSLDKSHYDKEVCKIVEEQVDNAIKLEIDNAEKRQDT